MVKYIIGFAIFAGLGLWLLNRGGGDIDLGGEKHDTGSATHQAPEPKK
jgi:hypothetical protein